jgi:hypothetical protein
MSQARKRDLDGDEGGKRFPNKIFIFINREIISIFSSGVICSQLTIQLECLENSFENLPRK